MTDSVMSDTGNNDHGADELRPLIVDDVRLSELEAEALTLPSLMVSSAAAASFSRVAAYLSSAWLLSHPIGSSRHLPQLACGSTPRSSKVLLRRYPLALIPQRCLPS